MSQIEKFISPFIAQQFPSFYKEEGPNFIAFVRAYYEWMEQSGNIIHETRSLLDYIDIDSTADTFITHFKNTFIKSLPETVVVDKKLLLKHILDLYRSKGTQRSYELLFRLVYGEDIELYIPSQYIFKTSDNTWKVPTYIETTSHPKIANLVGTMIKTNADSVAIVESVNKKIVNGRIVNILILSNVKGSFIKGDRIYQAIASDVTNKDGPIITGSLNVVAITNGGTDFSIGDKLNVNGSGVEAKAKVVSVSNNINVGAVTFKIFDGGTGFTTDALVTVKQTLNLNIANTTGVFSNNQIIVDSTTNANGTISFTNNSFVQIIDRSTTLSYRIGSQVTTSTGSATIQRISGGTGTGASFKVGEITNKEILNLNTDIINNYLNTILDQTSNTVLLTLNSVTGTFSVGNTVNSTANAIMLEGLIVSSNTVANGESMSNSSLGISGLYVYRADVSHVWVTSSTDSNLTNANLVPGTILVSNTSSSVIQLVNEPVKITITGNATIQTVSGSNVTLSSVNGYFIPSSILTSSSAATANITSISRLTNWSFPLNSMGSTNLDTTLNIALTYVILEVGTILYLSQINPGTQYTTKVYIDVIEPLVVALLNFTEPNGRIKGHNATIDSKFVGQDGIITAVEIIKSGYGYINNETVTLSSIDNQTIVQGITIVDHIGKDEGRWLNRKSFSSDVMNIQDSLFYQDFSYQIVAEKMLSMYETLVRNIVHPSGIALYGAYRLNDELIDDESSLVYSSII